MTSRSLSNELYSRIFSCLQLSKFVIIRLVSRYFNDIFHCTKYRDQLCIRSSKNLPKNFVNISFHYFHNNISFEDLIHVEYLKFGESDIFSSDIFEKLQYFYKLRSIKREEDFGIGEYDISFILNLKYLEKLEIHLSGENSLDVNHSNSNLGQLSQIRSLRSLIIMRPEVITMDRINLLNQCSNIERISIVCKYDNPNFDLLKHLKKVKKFKSKCTLIEPNRVNELTQLKELTELTFAISDLTQQVIDIISKLINLKKLRIRYEYVMSEDVDVNKLSKLKQLKELDISRFEYYGIHLQVGEFKNLKRIRIR